MANGIVSLISLSYLLFLVYRNAREFCALILYPATLPNSLIDFKIKTVTRDKEEHYIMIKESIQEEDITIVNIYATNIGAPQYIRQMLKAINGERKLTVTQ